MTRPKRTWPLVGPRSLVVPLPVDSRNVTRGSVRALLFRTGTGSQDPATEERACW